jgi:hypothetical protein
VQVYHKTIRVIQSVVLYGCEILSEQYRLRALKKMFGPKRSEVTGGCINLHNYEIRNFYHSPNIVSMIKSRRMIWTVHVARKLYKCVQTFRWETWKESKSTTRKMQT